MKALIVAIFALAATATPALAEPQQNESLVVQGERPVCTRVQLRGASRISYQRVCRTPAEWRQRLGPDWRQALSGSSPDTDLDSVDLQNRDTLETGTPFGQRSFGRPGGGSTGPQ